MRFDSDAREQRVDDVRDPRLDSAQALDEPADYESEAAPDDRPSDVDEVVTDARMAEEGAEADRLDAETDVEIDTDAERGKTDLKPGPAEPVPTDTVPAEPPAAETLPAEPPPAETPPAEQLPAETGATDLMPGDLPAEPLVALWPDETAQGFRDRWRDVQLRFVDDPRRAAGEAQALLAEVVDALSAAAAKQKSELDAWSFAEGGDTEELRVVVRRYRDFLDRVLGR